MAKKVFTDESLATFVSEIKAYTDNAAVTKADKTQAIFYIEGTGTTDTTNKVATWLGSHEDIKAYYDGLTIAYKVGTAGSTTTTLNINNLGEVSVVKNVSTSISSSYAVNSVVLLIYTTDNDKHYWKTADYDANTRNSVGDYRKNGTKLYFVGTASSDSSDTSSYATSYTNNNIYVTTGNVLCSAQGFSGKLDGNATSATSATKATQDASGNVITSTYETKTDSSAKLAEAKQYTDTIAADKADKHDHNYIPTSQKGAASGVAELDANGKVPTSQLPSYVDDVIEGTYVDTTSFKNASGNAITGESGKIYVDTATNITYRWSGTKYIEISPSLALGETDATAYRGDRGKVAYDHSQKTSGNPHGVTKSNVGLGNVVNTGDSATPVSGGTTKFTTGGAYTELAKKANLTHTHTVTHTPAGTISTPTFTGKEAGHTHTFSGSKDHNHTFTGTAESHNHSFSGAGTLILAEFSGAEQTASVSYTPAGSVSKPTFTGTEAGHTHSFSGGSEHKHTFTGTTAAHDHAFGGTGTLIQATFKGTEQTAAVDYTPAGTVGTPTITVTPNTTTVNSITAVGTLPSLSYTAGTASKITAWGAGSVPSLSYTAGTASKISAWSAGSLPSLTFSAGSLPSASLSAGSGSASLTGAVSDAPNRRVTLTFSHSHTVPSLTFSAGSLPSATWSAGSLPSLSYSSVNVDDITNWSAGSIPSLTYSAVDVDNITEWNAGELPTKGSNTTVVTSIKSATSTQPSFTGTAATISHKHTPSGTVTITTKTPGTGETANYTPSGIIGEKSLTPAGTIANATVSISGTTGETKLTPAGSVSQPTFSGTAATISHKHKPSGTVTITTHTPGTGETANYTPSGTIGSKTLTPAGTIANTTVSISGTTGETKITPAGTVSAPTFTGHDAALTTSEAK